MQYEMARTILQLKCKPAREALLGDLGWDSICNIIDKRQIDYFIYLKFSIVDGLHKDIFKRLYNEYINNKETPWPYFSHTKGILTKYGLDDVINRDDSEWYGSFLKISNEQNIAEYLNRIQDKTSLSTYKSIKYNKKLENYLKSDLDFYDQRIKFKARSGCFGTNSDLKRWGKSNGLCTVCDLNCEDTVSHRLIVCPHERVRRLNFHHGISKQCGPEIMSSFMQQDVCTKISWILGDGAYDTWGHEIGILFDKCAKAFLVDIYSNIKERVQGLF